MTDNLPVPSTSATPKSATPPSLRTLKRAGTDLIRGWQAVEETRTEILRRLAEVVVQVRLQFRDEDGAPDWRGKTWEYRQFIGEMYEAAGVPPDSVSNIQAALRYHVGNLVRRVAEPAELEAAGLLATSPKDRLLETRQEVRAIAQAVEEDLQSGDLATRANRYVSLAAAADRLVERMTAFELEALDRSQAADMLSHVADARARLGALERQLKKRV